MVFHPISVPFKHCRNVSHLKVMFVSCSCYLYIHVGGYSINITMSYLIHKFFSILFLFFFLGVINIPSVALRVSKSTCSWAISCPILNLENEKKKLTACKGYRTPFHFTFQFLCAFQTFIKSCAIQLMWFYFHSYTIAWFLCQFKVGLLWYVVIALLVIFLFTRGTC